MIQNIEIARQVSMIGNLLKIKGEKPYQQKAYETAAEVILNSTSSLCSEDDELTLKALPGIGKTLAHEIHEYCASGKIKYLERLLEAATANEIFQMSGLSAAESEALAFEMRLKTFDDLLWATKNGYVIRYLGKNSPRFNKVKKALESIPSWYSHGLAARKAHVGDLLAADRKFRRLYPLTKEWEDPKMSFRVNGVPFQASYSHSLAAKERSGHGDWVQIRSLSKTDPIGWTILTSQYGEWKGLRIIMGRIKESGFYYSKKYKVAQKKLSA